MDGAAGGRPPGSCCLRYAVKVEGADGFVDGVAQIEIAVTVGGGHEPEYAVVGDDIGGRIENAELGAGNDGDAGGVIDGSIGGAC